MKIRSILSALVISLLLAVNVEAAWTIIDSACANEFGNTAPATTPAIDTTGADLIVGFAGQATGFPHDVTDSEANSITLLTHQTGSGREYTIWYIEAPVTDAAHTFTSTNTAGGGATVAEAAICVIAVSGSADTSFDQDNGATNASSSTIQTGSITPTDNGQLIITGGYTHSDPWDASPIDSGFTLEGRSGTGAEIAIGYLIQATAAAINPTWTASATNDRNIVSIASFKVASTPSGSGHHKVSVIVVE